MLINTLFHKWGKLNLPTLLFKVGLLTLINMDSFIYLDRVHSPRQATPRQPRKSGAQPDSGLCMLPRQTMLSPSQIVGQLVPN